MYKFAPQTVGTDNPHYDPVALLDTLIGLLAVKNDRQLAQRLCVQASLICKVRHRRVAVSPALLISMQEETNLTFRQLRALMGDYRENTGPRAKHPVLPRPQYLNGLRPLPPLRTSLAQTFGAAA